MATAKKTATASQPVAAKKAAPATKKVAAISDGASRVNSKRIYSFAINLLIN